jgi:hypothetical protein
MAPSVPALLLRLDERPALPQALVGAEVVHAPEHHVLRMGEVVHGEDVAEEREAGGAAVLLAARGVRVVVGRAVEVAQEVAEEDGVGIVMAGVRHRFRPPLVADRLQLVGDEREGLVPRDTLELARLPLGVGAQHRELQPVGIARQVDARHALGAARADVVGRFRIALVVHDPAVAHHHFGRALPRAGVAEALHQLRALDLRQPGAQVLGDRCHGRLLPLVGSSGLQDWRAARRSRPAPCVVTLRTGPSAASTCS